MLLKKVAKQLLFVIRIPKLRAILRLVSSPLNSIHGYYYMLIACYRFFFTSVLYRITNGQVPVRVSDMIQKKKRVNKNDIELLTFYNFLYYTI